MSMIDSSYFNLKCAAYLNRISFNDMSVKHVLLLSCCQFISQFVVVVSDIIVLERVTFCL